jgi:hypothetical protein
MPGYLLIEEKMLKPFRSRGFEPNPLRLGLLDYLRELRQEVFPFTREHRLRIVGLEEVLLAGESHLLEISLFIRKTMAFRANELEANLGTAQVVFRRNLKRADDFWFETGRGRRITLRPIFGSPMKNSDPSGNEYYQAGFNLT